MKEDRWDQRLQSPVGNNAAEEVLKESPSQLMPKWAQSMVNKLTRAQVKMK